MGNQLPVGFFSMPLRCKSSVREGYDLHKGDVEDLLKKFVKLFPVS